MTKFINAFFLENGLKEINAWLYNFEKFYIRGFFIGILILRARLTWRWLWIIDIGYSKLGCFCLKLTNLLCQKLFSFKNIGSRELIQWNLDLRKVLGVARIFLKSRFFLISNKRKSLITYINNIWYIVNYLIMYSSISFR